MAKYVTAIRTAEGDKQIDYNALANLPDPVTLVALGVTANASELNILDGVTATTQELNYVDGVSANIQTQLNAKVPTSRTVNGKALSSDITLSASDVGAATSSHTHTASDVGAAAAGHTHTPASIGAAASEHTHTASDVGAVPTSRAVNGKALSADITLSASDVGAAASEHMHDPAAIGAAYASHTHGSETVWTGAWPVGQADPISAAVSNVYEKQIVVEGYTIDGSALASVVIPQVYTSAKQYQFADEGHWVSFNIYATDSSSLIIANVTGSNSGSITAVYAI